MTTDELLAAADQVERRAGYVEDPILAREVRERADEVRRQNS